MAKYNLKRKKGTYGQLTPYNDTIKIVLQHNEKYMLQNSLYMSHILSTNREYHKQLM